METPSQNEIDSRQVAGRAAAAGYAALPPKQLRARAVIAGDLFREGRIDRGECFRLEVDAAVGKDSGPVNYKKNTEYAELVADGLMPRKPHNAQSTAAAGESSDPQHQKS